MRTDSDVIRLAIVEDEGLFRDLLAGALSALPGLQVERAFADAATAAAEIPALAPDVALLDIHLGCGRNGVELGLELRKALPNLGIVLLSSVRSAAYLTAVPPDQMPGWSYLLKGSVRDIRSLERTIRGAAGGLVVLDPEIASAMSHPRTAERPSRLGERHRSLLALLAQGYSNAAIADRLCLSEKTVENQLGSLYRELGIDTSDSSLHPRVRASIAFLRGELD